MTHGAPSCSSVKVIFAPHGTCRSRWLCRARKADFGSSPGAMRIETLALATGTMALGPPAVGGAAMPRIEMSGRMRTRSRRRPWPDPTDEPAGATEGFPVEPPALGPDPILRIVQRGGAPPDQPGHRHVA